MSVMEDFTLTLDDARQVRVRRAGDHDTAVVYEVSVSGIARAGSFSVTYQDLYSLGRDALVQIIQARARGVAEKLVADHEGAPR